MTTATETRDQRERREKEMVAKYDAGATIRMIKDDFGVSYGTAHKVITAAGVMRPRGGGGRPPRNP